MKTYKVHWSEEDQQFVGTCEGFPSLSWLADTEIDALVGIHNLTQEEGIEVKHIAITIENARLIDCCFMDVVPSRNEVAEKTYEEIYELQCMLGKKVEDIS